MNYQLSKFVLQSNRLGNSRLIRVLCPIDTTKRYPVLYVHDGEYCFRLDTPSECECMSLDKALETTGHEMIIVTIEAMQWQKRTKEYSPFPWSKDAEKYLHPGEEEGDIYLDWLINEVKPLIDRTFPTLTDFKNTFLLGCSLGALISLYASVKYPYVFSKVGLMSLASWGNEPALLDLISTSNINKSIAYFMRVGTEEGTPRDLINLGPCYVKINENAYATLRKHGVNNIDFAINPGRRHKTIEWEKDMPRFISWLFE